MAAGPLPGKSPVVYDPVMRMPIDVFPCEDGHAQEREILKSVLSTIEPDDAWIVSRNFCTIEFTCGIVSHGAYFVIREHKKYPRPPLGKEEYIGKIETGKVFEQPILVRDDSGQAYTFRRTRISLKKKTAMATQIFSSSQVYQSVRQSLKRLLNYIETAGRSRPLFNIWRNI